VVGRMVEEAGKARMRTDSRKYFKALGAQIARARKSRGYTQEEVATRVGVSQQAIFSYENGERRVSVFLLDRLAKLFVMRIEDLAGWVPPGRGRPQRLSPRAKHHAERLQALSKTQQRFVIRIIDNLEGNNARL
jgi:transcriptional regulator with XRE-family HTH domain